MAAFTPVGVIAVVDGLGKFNSDLRSMDRSIQKTGDSAKRSTGKFKSFASGLGSVAAIAGTAVVAGLGAAVVGIVGFSASAIQAAISYESAFAGVLKTTDNLTNATGQLNSAGEELRRGFIDLSKEIPITPEALASIGEIGGQLGIGKENLLSFTETIAQLGVTTNLTTENAATSFARLINITGASQDIISNLGSATVALGNNFATTERDIANFALRIAGAGTIAGLTEADILAIGTAFSSVGVQAGAGGTAVQKVLLGINTAIATGSDQVAIFASTAGLSAQEFANLWETDASEAFRLFVEGLGQQGDAAVVTLKELGLQDQRLVRAFLSLAQAGDLLGETLTVSNQAFVENTALTEEANKRFATTESQIQLLKNTFNALKMAIATGALPVLNELIGILKRLVDENQDRIVAFFESIRAFVAEKLPIAVSTMVGIWNTTLLPLFQNIGTFIQETALPAFMELAGFLQEILPTAIKTVVDIWMTALQPSLLLVAGLLKELVLPAFEALRENVPAIVEVISVVWLGVLKPALEAVATFVSTSVVPAFANLAAWFERNMPVIQAVVLTAWAVIRSIIETVAEIVTGTIIPNFQEAFANLTEALNTLGIDWSDVWNAVSRAIGIVASVVGAAILGIIAGVTGLVSGISSAVVNITSVLKNLVTNIRSIWDNIIALTIGFFTFWKQVFEGDFAGALQTAATNFIIFKDIIVDNFKVVANLFDLVFGTAIEFVKGFVTSVIDFFQTLSDKLVGSSIIPDMFDKILNITVQFTKDFINALATMIDQGVEIVRDAALKFVSAGRDMIQGLIDGIKSGASALANVIKNIVADAIANAKAQLGISSPSRVFFNIGQDIVSGLIRGMVSRREEVDSVVEGLIDLGKVGTTITGTFEGLEESERGTAKFLEAQKGLLDFIRQQGLKLSDFIDPSQFFDLTTTDLADIGRQVTHNVNRALEVQLRGQVFFGDFLAGIEDQLDPVKDIIGDVRNLARGVGGLGRFVELEQLQVIEDRFKEIQLAQERLLMAEPNSSLAKFYQLFLSGLTSELVQNANELADTQQRLLSIQAKQSQLDFLKEQQKILDTIAREGLDPAAILQGITLGLDANINDLLAVQERLLEALIAQANQALGISSPSKVFAEMGQRIMQGLTTGVVSAMRLPQKAINQATDLMVSQRAVSAPGVVTNDNRAISITNNVRDNLDLAIIDAQLNRALGEAAI